MRTGSSWWQTTRTPGAAASSRRRSMRRRTCCWAGRNERGLLSDPTRQEQRQPSSRPTAAEASEAGGYCTLLPTSQREEQTQISCVCEGSAATELQSSFRARPEYRAGKVKRGCGDISVVCFGVPTRMCKRVLELDPIVNAIGCAVVHLTVNRKSVSCLGYAPSAASGLQLAKRCNSLLMLPVPAADLLSARSSTLQLHTPPTGWCRTRRCRLHAATTFSFDTMSNDCSCKQTIRRTCAEDDWVACMAAHIDATSLRWTSSTQQFTQHAFISASVQQKHTCAVQLPEMVCVIPSDAFCS